MSGLVDRLLGDSGSAALRPGRGGGVRRGRPVRGVRGARGDRRRARWGGGQPRTRLAAGDDGDRGGRGDRRRQRGLRGGAPSRAPAGVQPGAAQPSGAAGPGPGVPRPPGWCGGVPGPVRGVLPGGHARAGRHRRDALPAVSGVQRRRRDRLGHRRGAAGLPGRHLVRRRRAHRGRGVALAVAGIVLVAWWCGGSGPIGPSAAAARGRSDEPNVRASSRPCPGDWW